MDIRTDYTFASGATSGTRWREGETAFGMMLGRDASSRYRRIIRTVAVPKTGVGAALKSAETAC
jgi:hypothetical protein